MIEFKELPLQIGQVESIGDIKNMEGFSFLKASSDFIDASDGLKRGYLFVGITLIRFKLGRITYEAVPTLNNSDEYFITDAEV